MLENLQAGAPTHHFICKYLWKVDTVIHIFQQSDPVCGHRKLATN